MATTRVLLVEDHQMFRQGIALLLSGLNDIELVGEAADGRAALDLAAKLSPDVVIMDIAMPGLNGIEATRLLQAEGKPVKVIGLSGTATERALGAMMDAGASGFVAKEAAFQELAEALRVIAANETYVSPSLQPLITAHKASTGNVISARERETLQLIAEGKSTKEIARILDLSVKTVETYRRNLMEKLHIDSVAGLTKYAIREGFTSVN